MSGIYKMTNGVLANDATENSQSFYNQHLSLLKSPQIITDYLTLLNYGIACIHGYKRWNKTLFLELMLNHEGKQEIQYLVLYNCQCLEVYPEYKFDLEETLIYLEGDYLVIQEEEGAFFAKFTHYDIWSSEKRFEYDMDLYEKWGSVHGYGERKLVLSVDEL